MSAFDPLRTLEPLATGRYWEIDAVPDIREQAAALADNIAKGAWTIAAAGRFSVSVTVIPITVISANFVTAIPS